MSASYSNISYKKLCVTRHAARFKFRRGWCAFCEKVDTHKTVYRESFEIYYLLLKIIHLEPF